MPENYFMSRRRFAQLFGVGAAALAARPSFALPGVATESTIASSAPANVVRLSSNENPYGPSPMAIKAMTEAFDLAWRYPDEHAERLIDSLANLNGVKTEQILLGDGSGEILKVCASAFTGPMTNDRKPIELARPTRGPALTFIPGRGRMIVADPTFEAILNHARLNRAEVVKVPLTKTYAHDLAKMAAAAREGLIYICNPNNPTASITPKNELRGFIKSMPKSTMLLVDEAYHHYADNPNYESVIPLVKDYPNLIVARTFSKIYGMAGLRLGYCVAQPETIKRIRPHQTWDSVNIMALAAGIASLNDPEQVPNGRRLNSETKQFVLGETRQLGYSNIPSDANFVMIDVKRPVQPLIKALRDRNVQVGRLFPALPTHMRVTIGKQTEMETFMTSFREVMRTA
jgi:histidinol-phosphate/aromatic aminotransferase/cobyric acid decarboxylase-like protein